MPVIHHFEILVLVAEDRIRFALDGQRRIRIGRAAQLQRDLLCVVAVDVFTEPKTKYQKHLRSLGT